MYFFKNGLNTRLKVVLLGHTCYTLREMINKVLEIERGHLEVDVLYKEKKRRSKSSSRAPAPQRPHAHMPPLPRPHAIPLRALAHGRPHAHLYKSHALHLLWLWPAGSQGHRVPRKERCTTCSDLSETGFCLGHALQACYGAYLWSSHPPNHGGRPARSRRGVRYVSSAWSYSISFVRF
jgi:hypothetical protein